MNNLVKTKRHFKSSILNKILISFLLLIMAVGISSSYFFQLFLEDILRKNAVNEVVSSEVMNSFVEISALLTFIFLFIAIGISFLISRNITRPIIKLKNASREMAKGNFEYRINLDEENEIGELAEAFNTVVDSLDDYKKRIAEQSKKMEEIVKQKTEELENVLARLKSDKNELKNQRSAILNILEDVQDSQESLEESKKDLENRHYQLEILKSLGDNLTNVFEVSEAAWQTYEHLRRITNADVVTLLISNPFEEGSLYFKSFLNTSVSEKYIDDIKEDIVKYVDSAKGRLNSQKAKILENICPSLDGKKLDNESRYNSIKASIVPLLTGDNFYGLIHLSYCSVNTEQSDMEDSLSKAIGATLSVTIDRLQALNKSQNSKTESLIRSLNDGVIMFTGDKHIVLTNSRATVYTGLFYTSSTLDDFIRLFPGVKLGEMIDNAIHKGVTSHINEVLLINKFYEISVTPVKDNEGEIVGGSIIIHDITYMKEIDQMKTEFVSVASHQLRTPLTAIKLFTEVLVKEDLGKVNKEQKEYLENIYQSTGRMVRLVNDLLNVTRIESGKLRISPQSTDIVEFMNNLITEAEPSASKNKIKIIFNKCKLPKVDIDQNLFRQVIENLLSNAIRYSRMKGAVEITISQDDYYFYIKVKDDGIGIPADMRKRIFEKFYRADNAIKAVTAGTGLGLYTSKMIVEISGGKIWFESKEGHGTSFYVKMPLKGMEKKEGERGMMIS